VREDEEGKYEKKSEEEESMSSIATQNNHVMNMYETYSTAQPSDEHDMWCNITIDSNVQDSITIE
jgi:hypothetical protein